MKEIIENMIEKAEHTRDYELCEYIYELLSKLSGTWNCPSNWQDLAEDFANEYNGSWVFENAKMWDFI